MGTDKGVAWSSFSRPAHETFIGAGSRARTVYEGALVIPAPLVVLAVLLAFQARARRKAQLPMWQAYERASRECHLSLDECKASPFGLPELRGVLRGRWTQVWSSDSTPSGDLYTLISVRHTLPVESRIFIYPGKSNPWEAGRPGWERIDLPIPQTTATVVLVGPKQTDVRRFHKILSGERERRFVGNLMEPEGVEALWWHPNRFDVALGAYLSDAPLIEQTTERASALLEAMEEVAHVGQDRETLAASIKPERVGTRSYDTAFAVFLTAFGAFVGLVGILVPTGLGVPTGPLFLGLIAASMVTLAVSRIYSSWPGPEVRRILKDARRGTEAEPL